MRFVYETSWSTIGGILVSGLAIYTAVVVAVRLNGLRTVAKMSGYDFAATVSIGSIIGAVALSRSTSIVEGVVALSSIVVAQRLLTEARRRLGAGRYTDNPPVLVVAHGRVIEEGLAATGMTDADLRATVRAAGLGSIGEAVAVVFEPTGERSVITGPAARLDAGLFVGVQGADHLGFD